MKILYNVCDVLVFECYVFLSFLLFTEYNIIGFPGISMGLFNEHGPCLEHDHETLRPIIVSTWMPEKVGGLPGKSLIFAESQVYFYFLINSVSFSRSPLFSFSHFSRTIFRNLFADGAISMQSPIAITMKYLH